jgi:WD40 repeat protein
MSENPQPSQPLRVFLCHSSGDKASVRALYQRLREDGIEPWFDEEDILPGQDWEHEITKAVRTVDVVIVCLSRESVSKTGYVQKEIRFALDKADEQPQGIIFIIPLKLEQCDVPDRLRRWHWVNYFEAHGYERLLRALRNRATKLDEAAVFSPDDNQVDKVFNEALSDKQPFQPKPTNVTLRADAVRFTDSPAAPATETPRVDHAIKVPAQPSPKQPKEQLQPAPPLLSPPAHDVPLPAPSSVLMKTPIAGRLLQRKAALAGFGIIIVLALSIWGIIHWRKATPLPTRTSSNAHLGETPQTPTNLVSIPGEGSATPRAEAPQTLIEHSEWVYKQTLAGHSSAVTELAFSPDGTTLASSSEDKTIKLWEAQTGALRQTLTGHSNAVYTIAFSPDSKTLASGSLDKTIKLWDVQSGTLKQTLAEHSNPVYTVAFSPDGKMLASRSGYKTIKLWDVQTSALRQTLTGHSDWVYTIAFSPDSKTLASGSLDKTIKLWDVQSGTLKQTLTGHRGSIYTVAFSSDGKMLASGSEDKTIKLWDTQTGALKQTLTGHGAAVVPVAFSPDSKMLASGSWDKTIKLWDTQTGALKQTLAGHSSPVYTVAFSPDGNTLVSGGQNSMIKLWKVGP